MNADDELHEYHAQLLRNVDTLVFGRKTYQLMVPFWPDVARDQSGPTKAFNDFARAFESVTKIVVFSHSLDRAEGNKTRIMRGNLRDEVLKLKREDGGNMLVGGVSLPSQLIELGLVDEFRFVVQPSLVGQGTRVLQGASLQEKLELQLVDSKVFGSGTVALRYVKKTA
jgi:dihydrofolate reductase